MQKKYETSKKQDCRFSDNLVKFIDAVFPQP